MAKQVTADRFVAKMCRESYFTFFLEFWSLIAAERLVQNWHIKKLCDELQEISNRVFLSRPKLYDFFCNCPPGTSKSSIFSVLWQPWVWTFMPSARFITGSHSERLALDLSRKSRDVVMSEKYRRLFPDVQLREDQNTKGYFMTKQGGFRYATGVGGSAIGMHAHFQCVDANTRILTDAGELAIVDIVRNRLPVAVLGYDHKTNETSWQPILNYSETPGRELYRVTCGRVSVEMTEDHPVFVAGRGYIPVRALAVGDRVIHALSMCSLSQASLQESVSCCSSRRWSDILHPEMFCDLHDGRESPKLQQSIQGMSNLWHTDKGSAKQSQDSEVLQLPVCRDCSCCTSGEVVSFLPSQVPYSEAERNLLFAGMCERRSFQADERNGQSQLDTWYGIRGVSSGVSTALRASSQEGSTPLFSVWQDEEGEQTEPQRSSCRLGQNQQCLAKHSQSVPEVPYGITRPTKETATTGRGVVTAIERSLRIPQKVYNLEVAETHNYFANSLLVHNCVDDPIDPMGALSDLVLAEANFWMTDTLSQRKVDKQITVLALVMQRLHQDDPTGHLLEMGGRVRHWCLPCDRSWEIKPPEFAAYYEDNLFDTVRLPQEVLAEQYKVLGESGYAGQYGQNPVPRGGALFKVDKLNYSQAIPQKWKRGVVRSWDKAATQGGGAYTAGVKMGLDEQDRVWILDMVRGQWDSGARERRICETAQLDGKSVRVVVEQEPAGSGKESAENTQRALAKLGFRCKLDKVTGDKELRADPLSVYVNQGRCVLVNAPWNHAFVQEMRFFPRSRYKDQIDAASGGFAQLVAPRYKIGAL